MLRSVDQRHRILRFHTDVRSSKSREITVEPRVALHVYDRDRKVQIRIEGLALLHADDHVADDAWRATRPYSRACYRIVPAPGDTVGDPSAVEIRPATHNPEDGRENFQAVSVRVDAIEWLFLSARGHRRARFEWNDTEIDANWLVP